MKILCCAPSGCTLTIDPAQFQSHEFQLLVWAAPNPTTLAICQQGCHDTKYNSRVAVSQCSIRCAQAPDATHNVDRLPRWASRHSGTDSSADKRGQDAVRRKVRLRFCWFKISCTTRSAPPVGRSHSLNYLFNDVGSEIEWEW